MEDSRFAANANVHNLIDKYQSKAMLPKLECLFEEMLEYLYICSDDPNVKDTPQRLAKMFVTEIFRGRYEPMPKLTSFPNTLNVDELFTIGPITFRSCCSHHFVPFIGKAWIGIIPGEKLLGLSKFARLTDWVMARPQIQEEAIQMLADIIEKELEPKGLAIVMKAKHFCMCWRGIKDDNCEMTTSVVRGLLKESEARNEFLNLIKVNA